MRRPRPSMARAPLLAAVSLGTVFLFVSAATAADVGHHRRHHADRSVDDEPVVVPQGYAYGGYGNGPGPGWTDSRFGPPGYGPGYGYIPPGYPDAGFDLGR